MQYRLLGRSGTAVSNLALGTMTFGTETDEDGSHAQLGRFLDAGGNLVDTANVYSSGTSEETDIAGELRDTDLTAWSAEVGSEDLRTVFAWSFASLDDATVQRNVITDVLGVHGNGLSAYLDNQNIRFIANTVTDAKQPATFKGAGQQAIEPLDDLLAEAKSHAEFSMRHAGSIPPTMFAMTPEGLLQFLPARNRLKMISTTAR